MKRFTRHVVRGTIAAAAISLLTAGGVSPAVSVASDTHWGITSPGSATSASPTDADSADANPTATPADTHWG